MRNRPVLPTCAAGLALALAACASGGEALTTPADQVRSMQDGARTAPPFPPDGPGNPGAAAPSARPAGGTLPGKRPNTLTPDDTVEFCTPAPGVELLMDIYYPDGHSADSNDPAIVYVHGGGWTAGSRDTGEGSRYIPALVSHGYVVFAIDYRLAPEYPFPAQIEDAQCAIRHVRAEAATYGIDPDRIGAMGGSAGGQLVNLLGVAEDGDFATRGGYEEYSSEVQAVAAMYGASDFSDPNMANHNANHVQVFGTGVYEHDPSNTLWMASAVNYIDAGDADYLLLHGEEDPVVPVSQSEIFSAALEEAGVSVDFVRVANAGHGFDPAGGRPDPSANALTTIMVKFFESHL